ncbi:MAG: class I SAM-dependent methyltransferase [Chloroflexi bacterium]|nr:MAG: class I SAM-dependent methyltransferase [Chloroflexota bacterium]
MNAFKTSRAEPIGNLRVLPGVVAGALRNSVADPRDLREGLLRNVWTELKRFSARNVRTIEMGRIRGIHRVTVEGPVVRHGILIVSALAAVLECERIFEFGTSDGETSRLLAHNLPAAEIYSFDAFPDGERARASEIPQALGARVARLSGDSETYDFVPYSGIIDLVHIDASRRVGSLQADTDAAFGMLSELGSIVWYGYSYQPALYRFLNALAPALDRPIYHLAGTRLALYSRWDIVASEGDP